MQMEGMPIMELQIIYYYLDLSFSNIVTIISKGAVIHPTKLNSF